MAESREEKRPIVRAPFCGCVLAMALGMWALVLTSSSTSPTTQSTDSAQIDRPDPERPDHQKTVVAEPSAIKSNIPADVQFQIIKEEAVPGRKRSLDIRLNRKVTKDVLREIARDLKGREKQRYQRTFILYYLPGMTPGTGAWASTHYNPRFEVKILGLTIKQEKALVDEVQSPSRKIIGIWLDDQVGLGSCRITIYRERRRFHVEQKFKDGSVANVQVAERRSREGRKFEQRQKDRMGEHFIIDRDGNLQVRDKDGLISTARKIR